MNFKPLTLAIIILITYNWCISHERPVREPINDSPVNTNAVYRCCEDRYYLLKGILDQSIVKEVTNKEVYDDYDEETILFNSRWCPI